ncbi:MAG: hypothetical protein EOP84_09240 [Verrucomicrobiaceae bacterium]|nr:MAG: hypothetical protein EOP84_09240 [Verrucomicrobiaceae bacterium]
MGISIVGAFNKIGSFSISVPKTGGGVVVPPPPPPPPAAPILYNYQSGLIRGVNPTSPGTTYGYSVAISGDGKYTAMGSNGAGWVEISKTVDTWPSQTQTLNMSSLPSFGRQVTFSGNGQRLFVGGNGGIAVFKRDANGDNFAFSEVITIANPQYGTALGVRPIRVSHDGLTVVANDSYETHVFKDNGSGYQRSIYYQGTDDTPTGATKMSSDGSTFLMLRSGAVVAVLPNGDISDEMNINATIESYAMSGDGLNATVTGPVGAKIFTRTSTASPLWNVTGAMSFADVKGIGRCDAINQNGTIFVTTSAGRSGSLGHARVYRKEDTQWIYHAEMYDDGGYGVTNAMAADGSAIAIGAPSKNTRGGSFIWLGQP